MWSCFPVKGSSLQAFKWEDDEPYIEKVSAGLSLHGLSLMPAIAIPSSCWLILILYCACLLFGTRVVVAFDCDFIRVSNEDGIKNGSFTAPLFNGHPIPPQGIQCIYTFIALSTERVRISFRDFDLAGRPPDCFHEYIDLYTELRNASEDLVQTDKFGGRFCGRIPPRERWSLYSTIIIVFSSNRNLSASFFSGTYEFVEGSVYDMGAPLHSPFSCTFVMKSWVKRLGSLVSPAYPGVYPQRIMCSYQFLGQKGQRVRVEFMDFDLFSGGTHCPYDRLIIYDGNTEQDPVIDAYCGPRRNLVVFSSQENLFISFITNRSGGENRGFHGIFAFDESWVDIGFVTGEHIRGTECDQRILSHGRNAGVIKSPNWPYPYLDNKECRYFIEGLNNPDDLERVKLNIKTLQMPQPLGALKGDCSAGGVFIWLDGRETRGKPDISICGSDPPRSTIISTDSKLLLKFISGSTKVSTGSNKDVMRPYWKNVRGGLFVSCSNIWWKKTMKILLRISQKNFRALAQDCELVAAVLGDLLASSLFGLTLCVRADALAPWGRYSLLWWIWSKRKLGGSGTKCASELLCLCSSVHCCRHLFVDISPRFSKGDGIYGLDPAFSHRCTPCRELRASWHNFLKNMGVVLNKKCVTWLTLVPAGIICQISRIFENFDHCFGFYVPVLQHKKIIRTVAILHRVWTIAVNHELSATTLLWASPLPFSSRCQCVHGDPWIYWTCSVIVAHILWSFMSHAPTASDSKAGLNLRFKFGTAIKYCIQYHCLTYFSPFCSSNTFPINETVAGSWIYNTVWVRNLFLRTGYPPSGQHKMWSSISKCLSQGRRVPFTTPPWQLSA